jgi:tetratricopeptide (TPR) repeat protein
LEATEDAEQTDAASGIAESLAQARGLIEAARFDQAEGGLLALLRQQLTAGQSVEAWYTLAVARRYGKDTSGALDAVDALLALAPEHSRAFQERGYAYLAENRPLDAAVAFGRAVELNPGLIGSWKALANLHDIAGREQQANFARAQIEFLGTLPPVLLAVIDLLHEGKLAKAEGLCRQFLKDHPHHIEAMRLLADIGTRLRVLDDAEFLLESCVELEPDNIRARSDYVRILNRKGKFAKACEQAKILCEAEPDNPAYQLAMGSALSGLGELEDGIGWLRKGLERTANKAGVLVMLGHAHKAFGDLDSAIESYREAYRLKPDYGDAYWSLANIKTYSFPDAELERIRQHEAAAGTAEDDRIHLCFAAGKAFEDREEYDQAFELYARGNALKLRRSGYDANRIEAMVDEQIEVCSKSLFEERGNLGCDSRDPIFIVGLPRAGSTLLEQILASHSMVDGTMELHEILSLAQRLRGRSAERSSKYPQILRELDDSYFRRFAEKFIDDTRAYRGDAPFFIDKMPNNFMHIGLIRLILPRAKVIDARRHPMACCFSGFKQLFGEGQDFTYGLEEVGRYYRDYVRLMDHWDEVLPGFVLRVMHEDVVDDVERQVRRILDFCGLPFEAGCLEFYKTKRAIKTPSSEQVRQPIYRSGLEQWRNFESHLAPLEAALGPALDAFNG